jgi:hypothetical protein
MVGLLSLAACAFPTQLQRIAVDQNHVVANTADSLTLLNILRASKWRPLHFTSISRISGNVDLDARGSVGAGVQLSGDNAASLAPGASLWVATNPNFDMMIHDSQAFQRGIMQPISPEIINYYLHTGWRSDLLTYLLVERIDFIAETAVTIGERTYKSGESIETLQNDPSDEKLAAQFHNFVACYTLSASKRPGNTQAIRKLSELGPVSLADLAVLDGTKFDLGAGPEPGPATPTASSGPGDRRDWVVRKTAGGEAVGLSRTTNPLCRDQSLTLIDGNSIRGNSDPAIASIYPSKTRTFEVMISGRPMPIRTSIDITFRSVDGIIYFLGEYLRGTDATRASYGIPFGSGDGERIEPMLVIEPGRGGPHDVSAELDGQSWHMPADCKCRNFQVIALIEQLFNLHKAGSAAPLSTAVRVVN